MKKKIVAMCATVALAAVAVGGTLAYFQDQKEVENTFTVGNVLIEIEEYTEGAQGEWGEYDKDQVLRPFDHVNKKVSRNKLVETTNVGSEAAYIRTFVTCPKDMYNYLGLGFNAGPDAVVGTNDNEENRYFVSWKDAGTFTINGEETSVFVCECRDIVAPEESVLSLTSVWLYPNVTNEIIASFGLTEGEFPVDVASQAIQAENLTYDEAMAQLGAIDQALMDKLFNN